MELDDYFINKYLLPLRSFYPTMWQVLVHPLGNRKTAANGALDRDRRLHYEEE
jgi:hypothetical protein